VKARLEDMGGEARGSTPEEMKNMVASQTQKWIQVVAEAKIPKQ
jgi:tripartite-type tricarboxylate transporter receptor subunit TctC